MKKIYLSFAAMMLAFGGFAQVNFSLEKAPSAVNVKQKMTKKDVDHSTNPRKRSTTLWSDDFSGTATWQTTNTGNPTANWTIGSTGPTGSFSSTYGTITSTGDFAMFDSDAVGNATSTQDALIFTGPINLSTEPAVSIEFNNFYSKYQGTCYVIASTDGTNWTQFEVNSNIAVNSTSAVNPELLTVNLTSVIGSSATAYIGFQYVGNWDYAWMVDDVCLTVPADDELVLTQPAFSDDVTGVNYYGVPNEQSGSVNNSFTGSITNVGANTQAGSNLEVTILPAAGGAAITTLNGVATSLAPGQTLDDSTTTSWNLGTTIGDFEAMWQADYPNFATDATPNNNLDSVIVSVTDFIYSRDRNDFDYQGGGLWNGDDGAGNTNGYVMANLFDIYATQDLTAISIAFNSSTAVGALVKPQVYEVDGSGNFNLIYDAPTDYVVATGDLSSGSANWINIPIDPSVGGGKLTLNAGTSYLVGFEHYGGPNGVYPVSGGLAPEQTVFLYDPTATSGGPWFFMTSTPSIRANFDPTIGVGEIEASNLELGQNAPNPFNGASIVNYSLKEAAVVTFEVTDVTGKVISTQSMGKVAAGDYTLDLNADNYAKGVYFYSMTAGKEKLTRRMVITK